MNTALIYSTIMYTKAVANAVTSANSNTTEAKDFDDFQNHYTETEFDLIVIDATEEQEVFKLSEVIRKKGVNKNTAILFMIPGKVKYLHSFEGMELAPFIGISKPFSKVEIQNLCRMLLNEKLQRKKLMNSLEEIEQFAVVAAHDLRAPLKNIYSYAEVLKESLYDNDVDKRQTIEIANIISGESSKLLKFVNDIFEYSRAGKLNLAFDRFPLKTNIKKMTEMISKTCPQTKIDLKLVNIPEELYSDEVKIQHIFQNLIENSVKYRKSENVEIEIGYESHHDFEATFYVKDNGIGIGKESLGTIFQPFRRAHMTSEGTGMGLAIVKKLVRQLSGDIAVESYENTGSCFRFNLRKQSKKEINHAGS